MGGGVAGTKVQNQQLRKKNKKDVRRGKKKRSSKTGSVFENEGVSLVVRIHLSITSCIERGNVRNLFLCTYKLATSDSD